MHKTYKQEYCPETDRTIIWEQTWNGETLMSIELVGWYCGKPFDDGVQEYADRNYKCVLEVTE